MEHTQNESLFKTAQNDSRWIDSIKVTLGSLDHREVKSFISSIPTVPSKLRRHNEETYSPKHLTIGPIHRGSGSHLLAMEEHKWRYMLALLHRTEDPVSTLDESAKVIISLDDAVRASYGDNIKHDSEELAKIMLLDGCFLLELILRRSQEPQILKGENDYGSESSDPILGQQGMLPSILIDLILLENQIPFFVIKTLARMVFPHVFTSQVDHLVTDLTLSLFNYDPALSNCNAVAHFLHLMHLSTFIIDEGHTVIQAQQELRHCATKLIASEVKLQPIDSHGNPANNFKLDISFTNGVLEISPLYIDDTTEVYLRNFIALEQTQIGFSKQFTSYVLFLKGLICSLQDIEMLLENRVLVKHNKIRNEDLLTLFGSIAKGVDQMDSRYSKCCKDLNTHATVIRLKKFHIRVWHFCRLCVGCIKYSVKRSCEILIHDHIPNVWKFIGVVVAAVVLILTIMQTHYAAISK